MNLCYIYILFSEWLQHDVCLYYNMSADLKKGGLKAYQQLLRKSRLKNTLDDKHLHVFIFPRKCL